LHVSLQLTANPRAGINVRNACGLGAGTARFSFAKGTGYYERSNYRSPCVAEREPHFIGLPGAGSAQCGRNNQPASIGFGLSRVGYRHKPVGSHQSLKGSVNSGSFETKVALRRIFNMQYRGVEFDVVRSIERSQWRWRVSIVQIGNRTGLAATKDLAAANARHAISWLLAAKKTTL
jgi:hypothetical protein